MAKVLTYVSSNTYDTLLNIMYPDDHAVERSLQEVERLIVQGHTVEYRFGSNMSTVLDIDRFNEFIRPKFADENEPVVNVQENSFQTTLNELTPKAPEINIVPKVSEEPIPETINLQPFKPFIPESVDRDGDGVKTNNDIPEENKVNDNKVEEEVKENKEETVEEQKETEQPVAEEESTEESVEENKKNKKSGKNNK